MSERDYKEPIKDLVKRDKRYTEEAYNFVSEAVNYTVAKLDAHRHVSALELLKGARELAYSQYGVVSGLVLNKWGLRRANDLGNVVYLLIGENILSASDDDRPEDFDIEFSFEPLASKTNKK